MQIRKIRVLIVDDSAFARLAVSRLLTSDRGIEVIGMAGDGIEALEKIKALKPDVVTLDVEMPRMNGLEALSRIMTECPTPVVMLSSLTGRGAETTIKALEIGAVDFFLKPSRANPTGGANGADLVDQVKLAADVRVNTLQAPKTERPNRVIAKAAVESKISLVVAIASSTGGPGALYEVIPYLPADIPAAFVVIQHMPPGFTLSLANRLNELSALRVAEAQDGDHLCDGQVLIVPGDYHMTVNGSGKVHLNQEPKLMGLRPAADITMRHVAESFHERCLGVVLTGMGSDGTLGAAHIKQHRGLILTQDEASCVVFGMPKSVIAAGLSDQIVSLKHMARAIGANCTERERVLA